MEIKELEQSKMDSVRFLAETNIKIGEARGILTKLEETETEYLEEREKKAIEKIKKVLEDSKDLLVQAKGNYEEIHQFYNTVCSFAEFLSKAYENFHELVETFNGAKIQWDAEVLRQQEEISEIRKTITTDKIRNANDRESIVQKEALLKKDQLHIESQRAQIKSALEILNKKNG